MNKVNIYRSISIVLNKQTQNKRNLLRFFPFKNFFILQITMHIIKSYRSQNYIVITPYQCDVATWYWIHPKLNTNEYNTKKATI